MSRELPVVSDPSVTGDERQPRASGALLWSDVAVEPRQPVEIELTPVEPRGERRELRLPNAEPAESSGPGRGTPSRLTERGRLLAVAGCVGLLALMIGWAAGRASVPEPMGVPTTTVPPPRSVSGSPLPEPDDADEQTVDRPRPTVPRTTTTSTLPDWSEATPIEIHEAVAGLPMSIVATNSTGDYLDIDFATGTVRRRIIRPMFGGVEVRAGPGWVLLMAQDGDSMGWLLEDGAEPVQVDIGSIWDTYWSPGSPVLWRLVIDSDAAGEILEAVGPDGQPAGERIVLPGLAYPQIADPLGGVVVDMPGGLYRFTVEGAQLLTTGLLFGLSSELMIAYECDADGACDLHRVDRASGESVTIDVADPAEILPAWSRWTVSPDGSQMLVHVVSIEPRSGGGYGEERLATLDLGDGSITPLTRPYAQSVDWSPDGRFVFYVRGQLMALDRTTGETFPVFDQDPRRIDTFAVRSAVSGG